MSPGAITERTSFFVGYIDVTENAGMAAGSRMRVRISKFSKYRSIRPSR